MERQHYKNFNQSLLFTIQSKQLSARFPLALQATSEYKSFFRLANEEKLYVHYPQLQKAQSQEHRAPVSPRFNNNNELRKSMDDMFLQHKYSVHAALVDH